MQNHNDDTKVVRHSSLEKYTSHFIWKVLFMRGSWRSNRTAIYWPATPIVITAFFPVLLGCSTGVLGAHSASCWFSLPHLISNWWTSCAPCYIIVRLPPFSCGRHKLHSFNPSTVKVIFWYSSTGCTCYLHRCISFFDSPTIFLNETFCEKHWDNFILEHLVGGTRIGQFQMIYFQI